LRPPASHDSFLRARTHQTQGGSNSKSKSKKPSVSAFAFEFEFEFEFDLSSPGYRAGEEGAGNA
ncbi:TPA: hypothetical protein ACKP5X_004101, partial [Stenotrophomonas maltophilia]